MEYVPDSRTVLGDGIQGGIRSSSYHPRAHGKIYNKQRFPRASQVTLVVKNPPASAGDIRDMGSIPGWGRSPGGGHATHSSILAGESHGQRSLVGYSPWGLEELDTTETI